MLDKLGISRHHLLKTSVGFPVADKRVMKILGVVPVFITTRRAISKEGVHTRQLLYIVKELKGTFISHEALEDLGVISEYFPQVPPAYGKAEVAEVSAMEQKAEVAKDCDSRVDKQPEVAPCGCPTVNVCMLWRVLQAHYHVKSKFLLYIMICCTMCKQYTYNNKLINMAQRWNFL